MTSGYHERHEDLSETARDLHRALASLMEELEAVDWYQQRVDATTDQTLKEILAHNRDEEIEHAAMVLEWLRRHHPVFDVQLRQYLFTTGPVVGIEEGDGGPDAGSLGLGKLNQAARHAGPASAHPQEEDDESSA